MTNCYPITPSFILSLIKRFLSAKFPKRSPKPPYVLTQPKARFRCARVAFSVKIVLEIAVGVLGELSTLLEKLRKVPMPKESGCKRVQKVFEKGINTTITQKS